MKTALTDEISWLKYLQFDLIMRHDMNTEAAKNFIINNHQPRKRLFRAAHHGLWFREYHLDGRNYYCGIDGCFQQYCSGLRSERSIQMDNPDERPYVRRFPSLETWAKRCQLVWERNENCYFPEVAVPMKQKEAVKPPRPNHEFGH